jgi:hypothetical protein
MPRLLALAVCIASLVGASAAEATTGELTQLPGTSGCLAVTGFGDSCGPASATNGADGMAVSPDGKSAYFAGASLGVFSRDTSTGALTQLSGGAGCFNGDASDGCTQATAWGDTSFNHVAVSPDGKNVYFADNETMLVFSRDTSTGALTQLGGKNGCVSGDGSDGNGHANSCVEDDASGGFVGQWVAVSSDGKNVYSGSEGINSVMSVFSRDTSTGALTQLSGAAGCVANSGTPTCTQGTAVDDTRDLVVSPDGKFAYVVSSADNGIDDFARNTSTGALTELTGNARCVVLDTSLVPQCHAARALRGDQPAALLTPDGRFLYVITSDPGGEGGGLVAFARDAVGGGLTQLSGTLGCLTASGDDGASGTCAGGRALSDANAATISADGESIYLTSDSDNAVDVFSVMLGSGALTQLSGSAGCHVEAIGVAGCTQDKGLVAPAGVAVTPDGKHVYVGGDGAVAGFSRTAGPARYTVTGSVSSAGGGSVSATSSGVQAVCTSGSCTVDAGDTVKLTASPASGHVFHDWTGACAGAGATCTLVNVQANKSAVAEFTTLAQSVPPQTGSGPPPVAGLNPAIGQLKNHGSGYYCAGSSCGSLSGLQIGQCATAIGGNSDLAITASCLKLKSRSTSLGVHSWVFTGPSCGGACGSAVGHVLADGVDFAGNGLEVDMNVDAAGKEHFSVSGSSVTVSLEGVVLDQGNTTWYFDPLANGGGYGTSWGHGSGQHSQTALPVPPSSNIQGLSVASAQPPTMKVGAASSDLTVRSPSELGGMTTGSPLKLASGTVTNGLAAATSGPPLAAGSAHQVADNCGTGLAGPLPTGSHALTVHFPSLAIQGLGFTDGTLTLNGLGHFVAKGTSHFPSGFGQSTGLRGVVDVLNGRLHFACIQGFNPPAPAPGLPLEFLDLHIGILTSPQLVVEGGAHVRSTDQLPLVNQYPFDATADAKLTLPDLQGDPWGTHVTGALSVLGHPTSNTTLDYWSTGYASIFGSADPIDLFGKLHIGQMSFDAAEDGSGSWFVEGNTAINYSGLQLAAAEAFLSNLGVGVCGTDAGVSVALSSTWQGDISTSFFSCDGLNNIRPTVLPTCSGLRTLLNSPVSFVALLAQTALAQHQCVDVGSAASARLARSAPPGGVLAARVSGRPPSEEFIFHGTSGAPVVTLAGPDGSMVDTATAPSVGSSAVVTRDDAAKTTTIAVRRPRAGAWLVKVADSSPAVTSFDSAAGLPPASVKASIRRGRGVQRILRYRVKPLPGQTITFSENGSESGKKIGIARGSHGTIRFTPSPGPAGTRQVMALIAHRGVPVKRIKVAGYRAPAPARLVAPRHLRLRRKGKSLQLTFSRVRGAIHYLVSVKTSDHRRWTQTIKGARLRIALPAAGKIAVSVSVSAVDRTGRAGRARRASSRVRVAPPKLEHTSRRRRPRRSKRRPA